MLRIFLFLLIVLMLGFGFSWFADRPGDVVLQWQGNRYETTLMVVLSGIVALVAVIMFLWWVARSIMDSPRLLRRFWRNRRRDRGYHALSQGLIAANSGDAPAARRFSKDSVKLLGREPLVDLLDAQTSLLEGNRDQARERFERMLEDDATRLVALRGLYLEAERQGAAEAARHYAEEAHKAAPALPWAGTAMLRYRMTDGDWSGALAALEANRAAGLVPKEDAKRQRAVLLTAQAMAEEPADPVQAAKHAREAHRLAGDFVPAAVVGAKALARNSDIGRAAGMLETVWKKNPHPEIAEAYVHLRMGDSAEDRLKRARKLAAMRANHPEGNIAIAEAAIDAHDYKTAREAMKPVMTTRPTERACLIMADIEEGEHGDKGRMRDWLARAVRAPKDAAWTADGHVSEKWLPMSPVTGRIDAFEWRVPVEQLDAPKADMLDAEGLEELLADPPVAPVEEPDIAEASGGEDRKGGASDGAAAASAGSAVIEAAAAVEADAGPKDVEAGAVSHGITESTAGEPAGAGNGDAPGLKAAGANEVGDDPENVDAVAGDAVVADALVTDAGKPASGGEVREAGESGVSDSALVAAAGGSDGETTDITAQETAGDSRGDAGGGEGGSTDKKAAITGKEEEEESIFALQRRPDDPGVDENEPPEEPRKRFGLF